MAAQVLVIQMVLLILFLLSGAKFSESARIFTIINHCKETIWPGVTPGESFNGGGFTLKPGQSIVFTAPIGWQGRIWGRSGCNFDKSGNGSCQTGDCGSSLKCSASGKPPASLAEFTLASLDFYDVSLVDGFNLPLSVTPINGRGNCSVAGCDGDLRPNCPSELAVKENGKVVACRSACDVFNTDEYCCRGNYGNPMTCQPTYYSKKFKEVCPTAYSYAYDDPTSIFTCSGTDYVIAFCSSSPIFVFVCLHYAGQSTTTRPFTRSQAKAIHDPHLHLIWKGLDVEDGSSGTTLKIMHWSTMEGGPSRLQGEAQETQIEALPEDTRRGGPPIYRGGPPTQSQLFGSLAAHFLGGPPIAEAGAPVSL